MSSAQHTAVPTEIGKELHQLDQEQQQQQQQQGRHRDSRRSSRRQRLRASDRAKHRRSTSHRRSQKSALERLQRMRRERQKRLQEQRRRHQRQHAAAVGTKSKDSSTTLRTRGSRRSSSSSSSSSTPDAHQHQHRRNSLKRQPKPKPDDGAVDPYCQSNIDVIDESHNTELDQIHLQHQRCEANPFTTHEYCVAQTDRAVDAVLKKTLRQKADRKKQAAPDHDAFVYPGTPDTAVGSTPVPDDPQFNQKWSDCFAGPRHSACGCNYVMRNEKEPKKMDCSYSSTINKNSFHPQQRLASEYISPDTPYRGLLCYHGAGSGKTIVMIGVIAKFLQGDPTRTIIVLTPPKLIQNFYDDLGKTETTTLFGEDAKDMTAEERERRISRQLNVITFESIANRLNGFTKWDLPANKQVSSRKRNNESVPTVGRGFGALPDGTRQPDTATEPLLNNTLIMIDEAHDLVTPEKAKYPPPDKAYSVVSAMRRATDCRILLMTATPMRDDPYELGVLLNMLKPPRSTTKFPEVHVTKRMNMADVDIVDRKATKAQFDSTFIHTDETGMQSMQNETDFIHRCKGLISYFPVNNLYTKFAKKHEHLVDVQLPDDVYATVREKMNAELKAIEKHGKYGSILDHKLTCLTSRKASNILGHTKRIVSDELASKTPNRTAKIDAIADNINTHYQTGKQFLYSFFDIQGCVAVAKRLESQGWKKMESKDLLQYLKPAYRRSYEIRKEAFADVFKLPLTDPKCPRLKDLPREGKRFVLLGLRESDQREFGSWKQKLLMAFYNIDSNLDGRQINLFIGNKGYAKGISLQGVRTEHIVEPPINLADAEQIMARGIRGCSHKKLRFPDDWHVDVYTYMSTHPTLGKYQESADQQSEQLTKTNTRSRKQARMVRRSTNSVAEEVDVKGVQATTTAPRSTAAPPPQQPPQPPLPASPSRDDTAADDDDDEGSERSTLEEGNSLHSGDKSPPSSGFSNQSLLSDSEENTPTPAPTPTPTQPPTDDHHDEDLLSSSTSTLSQPGPLVPFTAAADTTVPGAKDRTSHASSEPSPKTDETDIDLDSDIEDGDEDDENEEEEDEEKSEEDRDSKSSSGSGDSGDGGDGSSEEGVGEEGSMVRSTLESTDSSHEQGPGAPEAEGMMNPNYKGRPENYNPSYKYQPSHRHGGSSFGTRRSRHPSSWRTVKQRRHSHNRSSGGNGEAQPPPVPAAAAAATTTATKLSPRVAKLIQSNPLASQFSTKAECNRSEFCQWDDTEQKCKGLSIDYAVRKMSIMRAKLNQRFLDMLQVSAIDCLVFRELHDDRSRKCFVPDKSPGDGLEIRAYRGFNESEYETTQAETAATTKKVKQSNSSAHGANKSTLKCRRIKSETACAANDACYIERGRLYGFRCRNKESPHGVNHQKCPVYYDDKQVCNADPMCKWVRTGAFKSNYTCQNRYIKSLTDYEKVGDFAIGLMTTASDVKTNRHYLVYPLARKNKLRTEKDIHTVLRHFKRRCSAQESHTESLEKSGHKHTPLVSVLEELYEMIEQDATVVKEYESTIRDYIQRDSTLHADEWFEFRDTVNPLMNRIMEVYKVTKQLDNVPGDDENEKPLYSAPPDSASTTAAPAQAQTQTADHVDLSEVQKRVLLCTEKEGTHTIKIDQHDLLHLRNHRHTYFHYTFHIYFNNKHYFFESNERRGAPIALTQLADMKQIHKHIELLDLSIRLVFHVRHMKITQVDMRVYVLNDGFNVDDKGKVARTVFVDKDNVRHHLYSDQQCANLWEKHPQLQHPMPFVCKTNRDKQPRLVTVDGARIPEKCPYGPESGELKLPKTVQTNDSARIQASHCYRNWMHDQRHREWNKQQQRNSISANKSAQNSQNNQNNNKPNKSSKRRFRPRMYLPRVPSSIAPPNPFRSKMMNRKHTKHTTKHTQKKQQMN